jgi:hypothetical protein
VVINSLFGVRHFHHWRLQILLKSEPPSRVYLLRPMLSYIYRNVDRPVSHQCVGMTYRALQRLSVMFGINSIPNPGTTTQPDVVAALTPSHHNPRAHALLSRTPIHLLRAPKIAEYLLATSNISSDISTIPVPTRSRTGTHEHLTSTCNSFAKAPSIPQMNYHNREAYSVVA